MVICHIYIDIYRVFR